MLSGTTALHRRGVASIVRDRSAIAPLRSRRQAPAVERFYAARSRERAHRAVVLAPLQPPPADAQHRVPEAQELGGGERFGRRAVVAAAAQ